MNAKNLIEAETPKGVFQQLSAQGTQFQPRKLTPNEIERLADIIAMGPLTRRASDQKYFDWGYVQAYDEMPDTIEARPGFAKAFYSDPKIMGSIGQEWLDVPYGWRGRVRRRYEAEDPKGFIQHRVKRYAPADMLSVSSSHGDFAIYPDGRVAAWNPHEPNDEDAIAMAKIVKFDLDEWRKYWNWEGELPGGFDILDLGYWLTDGMYEPPEEDWREEIKRMGNEQ